MEKTTTIVIDLDGTILERRLAESLRLYLVPSAKTGQILPAAGPVLQRLAEKARIVAVTARCVLAKKNTDAWLEGVGLGFIPSVHSPRFMLREPPRAAFKTRAIKAIPRPGPGPHFGIGDRGSDLEAYLNTGLFPLMLSTRPGKRLDSVRERATARGLEQGRDYLLLRQQELDHPLWEAVSEYIEERI